MLHFGLICKIGLGDRAKMNNGIFLLILTNSKEQKERAKCLRDSQHSLNSIGGLNSVLPKYILSFGVLMMGE